jgi:hypothetical protein
LHDLHTVHRLRQIAQKARFLSESPKPPTTFRADDDVDYGDRAEKRTGNLVQNILTASL